MFKNKIYIFILLASFSFFIFCTTEVETAGKKIDTNYVRDISMIIDNDDTIHISYYDINLKVLKYANNSDASDKFDFNIVNNTKQIGLWSSIAVDSSGYIHISHHDLTKKSLNYSTNKEGSFLTYKLDNEGDTGQKTSITIDSMDNVHIFYFNDTSKDLKYATNSSGDWVYSSIDETGDVGHYPSVSVDSSDNLHVSYFDNTNKLIKYATNMGGSWNISNLHDNSLGDSIERSSLAIDSNDNIHIAFCIGNDLYHSTNKSGTWDSNIITNHTESITYPSIYIDNNDDIYISYKFSLNYLYYINNTNGVWLIKEMDGYVKEGATVPEMVQVGEYNNIAIDSNGYVYIVYTGVATGLLYIIDKP